MKILDRTGWHGSNLLLAIRIEEANPKMQLALFRKKQGELLMEKQWEIAEQKELNQSLKKYAAIPIVVQLRSENIIEKCIPDGAEPLSAVLGVKMDNRKDFFIQSIPAEEGSWTSVIRKTVFEEMLAPLQELRDRLIYVNMSEAPMQFLAGSMGEEVLEMETHEFELYASLLHFFMGKGEDVLAIPFLTKNQKKLKQHTLYTKSILSAAIVFFICFGILIGLQKYWAHRMQADMLISQSHIVELKLLDEQGKKIQQERDFLIQASSKTLASSRFSFFSDRILQACPQDLFVDQLIIHPSKKDLNQLDVDLEGEKPDILLQGLSKSSAALAGFSQDLQKLAFTEKIDLLSSEFDLKPAIYRYAIAIYLKP